MRKGQVIGGGLLALALLTPIGIWQFGAWRDRAALEDELRKARADGLATTPAEFTAMLPKIDPAQNAAPYYVDLTNMRGLSRGNYLQLTWLVDFDPKPANLSLAKSTLAANKRRLNLIEKAVLLPHCRMPRKWEDGAAMLLPDLAEAKDAARLLVLRGAVAASEGRHEDAILDIRRAFKVADHVSQDPTKIGKLAGHAIRVLSLRHLSHWAFRYRPHQGYLAELERGIDEIETPDLKSDYRYDLVEALSIVELCSTEEGRFKLGIKPDDIKTKDQVESFFQSETKGKLRIVRAVRATFAALDLPREQVDEAHAAARKELHLGMKSFPMAASLFSMLTEDGAGGEFRVTDYLKGPENYRVVYRTVVRALKAGVPKYMDTSDLVSPFSGKAVSYFFNGREISIEYSQRGGSKATLLIPPRKP